MSRWLSSAGFEGSASRIFVFSSLTVVVAGKCGKVKGPETPTEGDTTTSVNVSGSGRSSSTVGASDPAEGFEGWDMVDVV